MTTLIVWTGVDSRGPASIYLAADSKFSWTDGVVWRHGRKVFGSRSVPSLLGYCGDVLFATQMMSQALEQIETAILFSGDADFDTRVSALTEFAKVSFDTYPKAVRRPFCIVYVTRHGNGMASRFAVGEIAWSESSGWTTTQLSLPATSDIVAARGDGALDFERLRKRWAQSDVGGTSRAVFSAFCDHIGSERSPGTGGAPQLVGLYRTGSAQIFGIVWEGKRFLSGAAVTPAFISSTIEWRDALFQRCDPTTLNVIHDGQRHARPKGA